MTTAEGRIIPCTLWKWLWTAPWWKSLNGRTSTASNWACRNTLGQRHTMTLKKIGPTLSPPLLYDLFLRISPFWSFFCCFTGRAVHYVAETWTRGNVDRKRSVWGLLQRSGWFDSAKSGNSVWVLIFRLSLIEFGCMNFDGASIKILPIDWFPTCVEI